MFNFTSLLSKFTNTNNNINTNINTNNNEVLIPSIQYINITNEITEQIINSTIEPKFTTEYAEFVKNDSQLSHTYNEFINKPGKEHYRLLAYLSTLLNNANIIVISSSSCKINSFALKFNPNNKVHIFNQYIINELCYNTNSNSNSNSNRNELISKLILNSSIIFVDIEPHDGIDEYKFYTWLKNNNYKGLLIFDNIWYFKNMRNNLWYLIPPSEKVDLTRVGHISGIGIVILDTDYKLFSSNRMSNIAKNWTLVTAYFNLAKCSDASAEIRARDQSYYLSHCNSTMNLPYNLIIYTDLDTLPKLKALRHPSLHDRTHYIITDFEEFDLSYSLNIPTTKYKELREKIRNNREINKYHFDARNTASYYLFCMSRYKMLIDTIKSNPFNSTHFAWINICIERMGYNNLVHLDECLTLNRDKFSTVYIDYIPKSLIDNYTEYWKWGRCSMCSGYFTGSSEYMDKVCKLIISKFYYYLEMGYGHADEQLYSPVYFENPELFEHFYGDYQEMITNYKYTYDRPEQIINIFIKNSYYWKNYKKCKEACEFIMNSIKNGKCVLNNNDMNLLKYYMDNLIC